MSCPFCNIDTSKIENTILDETNSFILLPALGSLVRGYILIVSKEHLAAMVELNKQDKEEYIEIINKYRNIFKIMYGEYPIIIEHGSPCGNSVNSVEHAHTHIINHKFLNEDDIITKYNFKRCKIDKISKNKNYVMYINNKGDCYVSYEFKKERQLMRRLIAQDLGIKKRYNWRYYPFMENIKKTIMDIDRYNS